MTASRGASSASRASLEPSAAAVVRQLDHDARRQVERRSSTSPSASPGTSTCWPPRSTSATSAQSFSPWLPSSPPGGLRGQHAQAPARAADVQRRVARGAPRSPPPRSSARARRAPPSGWGGRGSRAPPIGDAADHVVQPGDVVGVSVREHEQVDPLDRVSPQDARERAGPASMSTVGPSGTCSRVAAPSPTVEERERRPVGRPRRRRRQQQTPPRAAPRRRGGERRPAAAVAHVGEQTAAGARRQHRHHRQSRQQADDQHAAAASRPATRTRRPAAARTAATRPAGTR